MTFTMYLAYASAVSVVGSLLLWWVYRSTRRAEQSRAESVEKIKAFDAVRTTAPPADHTSRARERGLESVASRFSILRRVLFPALCLLLAVALVLPLLGGAPANFLSLVVAVVAVIVSIAAKPLLENLFAGVVISFAQPVRIGDTVMIDSHFGTIEDISVTHTTVKIWDWRRYMVPNSRMIQKEFLNYSIVDRYQWAYVEFWVAPDANLEVVRELAIAAPQSSPHFAHYEEPRFWIMETAKDGIRCWVAAWAANPSSGWQLSHDTRTELMRSLQAHGIRTHVHLHRVEGAEAMQMPFRPELLSADAGETGGRMGAPTVTTFSESARTG